MNSQELLIKYINFKEECVKKEIFDLDEITRLFSIKLKAEGVKLS